MTKFIAVIKTGLCPEPRDFFRHGNIPKKSEKRKAEKKKSRSETLRLLRSGARIFLDRLRPRIAALRFFKHGKIHCVLEKVKRHEPKRKRFAFCCNVI